MAQQGNYANLRKRLNGSIKEAGLAGQFVEIGQQKAKEDLEEYSTLNGISEYFSQCNPQGVAIPWPTGPFSLLAAADIRERQAGYRWNARDRTRKALPGCPNEWIVVGTIVGDPVILNSQDSTVSIAIHGTGHWKPMRIARSFQEFLQLLEVWIKLYVLVFKENIYDDNGFVSSHFQEELRTEYTRLSGVDEVNHLLSYVTT